MKPGSPEAGLSVMNQDREEDRDRTRPPEEQDCLPHPMFLGHYKARDKDKPHGPEEEGHMTCCHPTLWSRLQRRGWML